MPSPVDLDPSQLIFPDLYGGVGGQGQQYAGQGPQIPTADPGIVHAITSALSAAVSASQSDVQANLAKQATITAQRQIGDETQSAVYNNAGAAAGREASAKATGEVQVDNADAAAQQATGTDITDPTSPINNSIAAFNTYMGVAQSKEQELLRAQGVTFLGALLGNNSMSDWVNKTFVNTPDMLADQANTALDLAKNAASSINEMQTVYTNQANINASAAKMYSNTHAADASTVAAAQWQEAALRAQDTALATGSAQLGAVIHQDNVNSNTAISVAADNLRAQSLLMRASKGNVNAADLEQLRQRVVLGMQSVNNPAYKTITSQDLGTMVKNPALRSKLAYFENLGMTLQGNNMLGNTELPSNLFGDSAGESAVNLHMAGVQGAPTGQEQVFSKLEELQASAGNLTPKGLPMRPIDKVTAINQRTSAWLNSTDMTSNSTEDPVYGQFSAPATVAAMQNSSDIKNNPVLAGAVKTILQPLAKNVKTGYIPAQMVVDSISGAQNLTLPQKTALIKSYFSKGSQVNGAIKRPQTVGLPHQSKIKPTATLSGDSMFGGKIPVDLSDEKSISDYMYRIHSRQSGIGY